MRRQREEGGNGPAVAREVYEAREAYGIMVASAAHQFPKAMKDSMQGFKDLMQAVCEVEGTHL